jgi:hypothetical protein
MLQLHTRTLVAVAGLALCGTLALAQTAINPVTPPTGAPVTMPGQPGGMAPAKQGAPTVVATPGAAIEFTALTHDFGVISDERDVETKFKFSNNGTADLEIVDLKGSCGCTVPQLAKKVYKPGEGGEITVRYNPHNRRGKQQTSVTVTTNVPDKASLTLSVQSEVKPTVTTEPQVASVGQIERGKGGTAKLMITSRKLDLELTQITPNDTKVNAVIGAKIETEIEGEKVVQFPIEVQISPTAAVGPIQTQCTVRTNDPARTLNFMVLGEITGIVKADPQRVTLGGLASGADINTTFRLSSRNADAFKVLSVEEQPANQPQANNPQGVPGTKVFAITMSEDTTTTPASWVVSIKGKAPAEGNAFRGDILVTTNVPGEENIKIPYYGFVRAKPKMPVVSSPSGQPSPSMLVPEQ